MTRSQQFIVYRDELLAGSETFILGQSESLPHFQPFYVGLRRRPGLSLPETRVHIISGEGLAGKLQRARFRLLGPSRQLLVNSRRQASGPDPCAFWSRWLQRDSLSGSPEHTSGGHPPWIRRYGK